MFYSEETSLIEHQHSIEAFWKMLDKGFLDASQGSLFYAFHIPQNATQALVISTGRIESAEKYKELLWELSRNRIACFILDHQGQGRSFRHLSDTHKGFVVDFSHYAEDLALFDEQVVNRHWQGKKIMLGHSMGGAIAFDYLSRFHHQYSGLFLSAPMFGINTGHTPLWLARLLARIGSLLGMAQSYAPGQGPYLEKAFNGNALTHSELRYQVFRQTYRDNPQLQLGGATLGWLNAAFTLIDKLPQQRLSVPLRVAIAGDDEVVSNHQAEVVARMQQNVQIRTIASAAHELLFESDDMRRQVVNWLYEFCSSIQDLD